MSLEHITAVIDAFERATLQAAFKAGTPEFYELLVEQRQARTKLDKAIAELVAGKDK